ncbi:MAG: TonB-dependent receptor, partial [Candidatus Eremiobacteraeota bacterium]|nr:TonB-dependent receptor [Candidatus Eremiobacteraeota bacterium]
MQLRLLCALLAGFLVLTSVPLEAAAQTDSGQIVITITDSSAAKVPVPLARVLLDGPVMTSEYSGNNGAVKFTDVPDGIYRARVFKGGYQSVTSEQFEVSKGRVVSVAIVLAASENLKEIGSVTVHSSATVSTSSVTDASTQRKLSGNLADALNKLSGVSVDTSSSEGDSTQTVSLQGQDASQTSLTLDGVPLNAPGSAGNLGSLSTDLFRGASVSKGPQAGALAGGVNFRTLEPTLAWQGTSTLSAGSYGKYNWSFGGSGSIGKLGIAVQHAARTTPSLANAMTFSDASGLRYEHDAVNHNTGDLVKLRLNAGNAQTLTGTYVDANVANDLICLEVTGALPCGYGPGNTSSSHFQLLSLTDSALIGQTALQAAIFQTSVKFDRDLLKRVRDGIADPTGSFTDTSNRGISLSALLAARERHTISIAALVNSSSTTVTPFVRRTSIYNNGSRTSNYSSLTLTDSIQSSTKLKLSERIGFSQASNAHASLLGGVTASWSPTQTDLYTASYSLGGAPGHAGPPGNFSDPSSLRFDCDGNIAYGTAPGDVPGTSSSTDARLNWQHRLKRGVVTTS